MIEWNRHAAQVTHLAAGRGGMLVPGDAATTAHNISASEGLFRLGIAADVVAFASDVVMGWALYELLKTVDKSLALLGAFFRVANAAILAVMAVLFERDTLIADLQQENNELRQTITSRDMQISALAKNVEKLEQQIATVEGQF